MSDDPAFGELAHELREEEGHLVVLRLGGALDRLPPEGTLAPLSDAERAHAAGLPARRARTWAGGRLALRRALSAAGVGDAALAAPIFSDDRGAPRLPAGTAGSIAHKDEVAAAVAVADARATLGVDVEPTRPLAAGLERRILTASERRAVALDFASDADRGRELLRRFSAKEAIYKAIDPFVRRYVGFLEVSLEVSARGYAAAFAPRPGEPLLLIEVRVLELAAVTVAVARAQRD